MPRLSGNIGEWSEIYTFLYLLAYGRLYAADSGLEKNNSIYYDILKIIREEGIGKLEFSVDSDQSLIHVINSQTHYEYAAIPMIDFKRQARSLFFEMSAKTQPAFYVPEVEDFLDCLHIETLKARNTDKADIRIKIHDIKTGFDMIQGFSIKSQLGSPSTLVNASGATNFRYKISGALSNEDIQRFNNCRRFDDKFSVLRNAKCSLLFDSMENETFECNLLLIDSYLPQICTYLLLNYYVEGKTLVTEALHLLEKRNPLGYNLSRGHHYYEYKFKKFLSESALGMLPSKPWNGLADATGGYIIVKENGDVVCYHLFNHNEFEQYLLNNTKFETASTSRHGFGKILRDSSGCLYLVLNLQIRFIK